VLEEFDHLSERGDVLGAMETGYQRSKIQEESLHYERLKHSGEYPLVGVNTFLDARRAENVLEASTLTRATADEKNARLAHLADFQLRHLGPLPQAGAATPGPLPPTSAKASGSLPPAGRRPDAGEGCGGGPPTAAAAPWHTPTPSALSHLQHTARTGGNLFAALLRTVCSCSLGQITHALYEVGGQYRRSM
jgi:methylmalonyl-CoA mutase